MKVDVSEGVPFDRWAGLPADDRVLVGGHTVWTGPFRPPVIVAQPNRWGVVEGGFPAVECVVEADPVVTGGLPLPQRVVGFVDRAHRPVALSSDEDTRRRVLGAAASLAKALTQVKGVRVAATPFARTIPLLTPREPEEVIGGCSRFGVEGIRPLPGLAGGIALSVDPRHTPGQLHHVAETLRAVVNG